MYPVSAVSTVGWPRVVKALINLNGIVATFVFVFKFECEESKMNVLPDRCFNYPVTILFVVVVVVAKFSVRVEVLNAGRRLQMAATNFDKQNIINVAIRDTPLK